MTEHLPDTKVAIDYIVEARDLAIARMKEAAEITKRAQAIQKEAIENMMRASYGLKHYNDDRTLQRQYDDFISPVDVEAGLEAFRVVCDSSVWKGILETTGLVNAMDAKAKEDMYKSLNSKNPPEITFDNVQATIETFAQNAPDIWRRGVARTFSSLDKRFKSHDVFRFKSRVIMNGLISETGYVNYYSCRRNQLIDVERVFAILDKETPDPNAILNAIDEARGERYGRFQAEIETRYFRIKTYKNGNVHMWFTRKDLLEKVNKELAAYYGAVLPDAAEKDAEPRFKTGTAVAKDLQFYRTPEKTVKYLYERYIHIAQGATVLEPSAGDGALIKPIIDTASYIFAVEFDAERADALARATERASNVDVMRGNFLTIKIDEKFDNVVANPPFFGTHYMAHVYKAFSHLKPGGTLFAILPVTAEIGESPEHVAFHEWIKENAMNCYGNRLPFVSLESGSFKESGTNIETVLLEMRRKWD